MVWVMLFRGWEAFGPLDGYRALVDRSTQLGAMAEAIREASGARVLLRAVAITPDDRFFAERFLGQSAPFVSLRHSSIPGLLERGRRGRWAFQAFEALEPPPLTIEKLLRDRGGRFSVAAALAISAQLAGGLQVLADQGFCFRNLHPGTVGALASGRALFIDFGSMAPIGTTGGMNGELRYQPPEILELDEACAPLGDLYSLGVLLYEMVSGAPPFGGLSAIKTLRAKRSRPPRPLSEKVAGLPAGLDAIIARSMHPTPARRFSTARDMEAALRAL